MGAASLTPRLTRGNGDETAGDDPTQEIGGEGRGPIGGGGWKLNIRMDVSKGGGDYLYLDRP